MPFPLENCSVFGNLLMFIKYSITHKSEIRCSKSNYNHGFIGGVMVSMLASNEVDRRFIGGVMVSMLASNVVDRGFIGGVVVRMLARSA